MTKNLVIRPVIFPTQNTWKDEIKNMFIANPGILLTFCLSGHNELTTSSYISKTGNTYNPYAFKSYNMDDKGTMIKAELATDVHENLLAIALLATGKSPLNQTPKKYPWHTPLTENLAGNSNKDGPTWARALTTDLAFKSHLIMTETFTAIIPDTLNNLPKLNEYMAEPPATYKGPAITDVPKTHLAFPIEMMKEEDNEKSGHGRIRTLHKTTNAISFLIRLATVHSDFSMDPEYKYTQSDMIP
jgi:hypothetical protein